MKYFLFNRTSNSLFRLEKQYLDLIDESGTSFIIYRAELTLMFMKIHYCEVIFSDRSGNTCHDFSFNRSIKPGADSDIYLDLLPLHISGSWISIDKTLPALTFRNASGKELIWNCHHPVALTEIRFRGTEYRGFGYAETLSTTIKPGLLPMNEVLWGRFHAEAQTIVWICWKGDKPLNNLYFNGTEFNDAHFEQDRITFNKNRYSLIFLEQLVIRSGKLSSLFEGMKWIRMFPGMNILNSVENKFKSRTRLELDNIMLSTGWSLYETVIWKSKEKLS